MVRPKKTSAKKKQKAAKPTAPRRKPKFAGDLRVVDDRERYAKAHAIATKLFADAVRVEGPDGELRPLSVEDIADVGNVEKLHELIEDEWPEEHRRMLSPLPANHGEDGSAGISPFVHFKTDQVVHRDQLVEDLLEILSLASHVLRPGWDRDVLLTHEADTLQGLHDLLTGFRTKREKRRDEAAMFRILETVVRIYRAVKDAWPERARGHEGAGFTKLGASMNKEQSEAIAHARTALTRLAESEIKSFVPSQPTSKVVETLLVDGAYLRRNDHEVSVATELLSEILPTSASSLRNLRYMAPLEATVARRTAPFVPPTDLWTDHKSPRHAEAHAQSIAHEAGRFAHELVMTSVSRRAEAPPPPLPSWLQRRLPPKPASPPDR